MKNIRFAQVALFIIVAGGLSLAGIGCNEYEAAQDEAAQDEHTQNETEQVAITDYCQEHKIAESKCPFCQPQLIQSMGFCRGHGVPEALCFQCDADLIPAFKAANDWCGGHDRPESQCYICNPELDPANATIEEELESTGDLPRRQQRPSQYCATEGLVVTLESEDLAIAAGIGTAKVELRTITKTIGCNAEVIYNRNRYARISSQVPGVVDRLHKEPGDLAEPGEALATINSSRLGSAKATYLQAIAATDLWNRNQERETDLLAQGVSTEKDLIEAEIHLAESRIALGGAEQTLLSYGISAAAIAEIRRTGDTSASYTVTAPLSGTIVKRWTAMGEVVGPANPLFAVADLSQMWVNIDIYETDLREVRVGQEAVFQVEALPGELVAGAITWVSSELDPQTRTLSARAEVANPTGQLRAHMFAHADVTVRDESRALVVPESAVQWEGCCNVVFVRQSPTVFLPRKVHLGIATGTVYEVLSGLTEGEEIVTEGSFLLKTEILKSSIGAGCCEVDPGA